jgi:polysaccharide export outer membrane protein
MNSARYCSIAFLVALLALVPSAVGQTELQQIQQQGQPSKGTRETVTERSAALSTAPRDIEKLRIAPGFLLNLSVLNDSDFSGSYRVNEHGDILVPYLGALPVSGKTETEAREEVRQRLIDLRLMLDPQVLFSIQEYIPQEVTIIGEVNAPGKYPLLAPHDLPTVLTLAGGQSALAGNSILVTSPSSTPSTRIVHESRATPVSEVSSEMIYPGDTVQVERAGIVYVVGAVNHPGGFVMQDFGKLTLAQAISLAGGTDSTAYTKKIYIVRKNEDGSVVQLEVPLEQIIRGKSPDVALLASDAIYVPNNLLKTVMVNSQLVLSTVANAAVYTLLK